MLLLWHRSGGTQLIVDLRANGTLAHSPCSDSRLLLLCRWRRFAANLVDIASSALASLAFFADICLGYALQRFLFPSLTANAAPSSIIGRYDMLASDLFKYLATAAATQFCTTPSSAVRCVFACFTFAQCRDAITARLRRRS